jgi:hypothetical protein
MGIYDRHALAHHQFLADVEPSFDSSRDFRVELFPPHASAAFVTRSLAPAALPNVDWRLITNVALYLNDELFRSCCHVRDDRIVRRIPLANPAGEHDPPASGPGYAPPISCGDADLSGEICSRKPMISSSPVPGPPAAP